MDLETENRIAAILMKEAAELRRQAEKDGVHVYLQQPNVRGRPNSRFLTATVLGVQQANRAVEVNEMWRVRQKELELDDRLRGKRRDDDNHRKVVRDNNKSYRKSTENEVIKDDNATSSCPSSKRVLESCRLKEDDGLKDEELQEFLHSRVKRGRGGIGSRMDETGPYLPPRLESNSDLQTGFDITSCRVIYGPDKPSSPKSYESSEQESDDRPRKSSSSTRKRSDKQHSKKHSSKSKSKKKKRKEKRSSSSSSSISKHHR